MNEQQSTWPPVPHFYKLFDTIEKVESIKPPPPIFGTYTLFGKEYTSDDVLPSLEEQGVESLMSSDENTDRVAELRTLVRLLLRKFVELLDEIIVTPENYQSKVEVIEKIFLNLQFFINNYQPHIARETIISKLEAQLVRRKEFITEMEENFEHVSAIKAQIKEKMKQMIV